MSNDSRESTVQIAEFKSPLSQYLKTVRDGHPLVLLNRDIPVATVLPYLPEPVRLLIRNPTRTIKKVHLPQPLSLSVDSLPLLLAERQENR